jgi:site-specific DNA-methyltransferase (adenine-specific)
MNMNEIIQGDCLEVMKSIPDGSVDMVMTDPPYGTTACKWDSIIPLEPMWEQLKRVIKPNGAIVMTASQPFTTTLIASNMKMFKYCWVWDKKAGLGFFDCKFRPLKSHEDIIVFGFGGVSNGSKIPMQYHPQGLIQTAKTNRNKPSNILNSEPNQREFKNVKTGYPKSILTVPRQTKAIHPTQKPVALMEYLIKTYTNEGELVLDFTCGSGTTCVACVNLKRNYIGIERDEKYVEIARKRVQEARGLFT